MLDKIAIATGIATLLSFAACLPAEVEQGETSLATTERIGSLNYFMSAPSAASRTAGAMVTMANQESMYCVGADESSYSCAVDVVDFTNAGLDPRRHDDALRAFQDGQAIVEGWMERDPATEYRTVRLHVLSIWENAVARRSRAAIYTVEQTDDTCVRAPCASYMQAARLHSDRWHKVLALDLIASGADRRMLRRADQALAHGQLLVAGEFVDGRPAPGVLTSDSPVGTHLRAENFYVPMQ